MGEVVTLGTLGEEEEGLRHMKVALEEVEVQY